MVLTGYEAESATLTCYVSQESATVRWMKDWTAIDGERFQALADGHRRSLTIQPLRRSDAGEYTCDANTDQAHFSLLVKGRTSSRCLYCLYFVWFLTSEGVLRLDH